MARWFFIFGAFSLVGGCDLASLLEDADKDDEDDDDEDDDGDGDGDGDGETIGTDPTGPGGGVGGSAECEAGASVFCDCSQYTDYPCTQATFDGLVAACDAGDDYYAPIVLCLADYQPVADVYDCVDAFEECLPGYTSTTRP